MRLRTIITAAILLIGAKGQACTNLIVGRNASVDGSIFVSYNADSYGCYGEMLHFDAGKHQKGSMRKVFNWESNKYQGEIEEAEETYNVVGNINEHQLTITETTFGGREELADTTGILDYGSLIYIALQRSKTAREAIKVMTGLVEKYGYNSEGETFAIADTKEVWIMEMIGKGVGNKGAVWVAVRIPDDCISAHANQSRIHQFMQYGKEDCMYSKDVVSVARKKGYFKGNDKDFDFANAYAPLDFGAARACEARVWAFFRQYADMSKYQEYISGYNLKAEPMPLFIKPNRKLALKDVMNGMRDHYEGTDLDLTQDIGAGAYLTPYRPRPLGWEYEGKKYYNERPISTQQTSFTMVAQMRDRLPNAIGGIIWFGHDDANMVAYTPVYCCSTMAPSCYTKQYANDVTFSLRSAFWVCNWVANMVYPRYSLMFDDVKKVRDELEENFIRAIASIDGMAKSLYDSNPSEAVKYLTEYSVTSANEMLERWIKLGEYLIVKYNDMVVKPEKDGHFEQTPEGLGAPVKNVGYPDATRKRIVNETGTKFLEPENK